MNRTLDEECRYFDATCADDATIRRIAIYAGCTPAVARRVLQALKALAIEEVRTLTDLYQRPA